MGAPVLKEFEAADAQQSCRTHENSLRLCYFLVSDAIPTAHLRTIGDSPAFLSLPIGIMYNIPII